MVPPFAITLGLFIILYLITVNFMGGWAFPVSALVSLYITFLYSRGSWEKDILKNLKEPEKTMLDNRVRMASVELNVIKHSFNKKLEDSDFNDPQVAINILNESLDEAFVTVLGIIVELSEIDRNYIVESFRRSGRAPLDKKLISELDHRFNQSYTEIFGSKLAVHHVPFPRMYRVLVEGMYFPHINHEGVLTRARQLKASWAKD